MLPPIPKEDPRLAKAITLGAHIPAASGHYDPPPVTVAGEGRFAGYLTLHIDQG